MDIILTNIVLIYILVSARIKTSNEKTVQLYMWNDDGLRIWNHFLKLWCMLRQIESICWYL